MKMRRSERCNSVFLGLNDAQSAILSSRRIKREDRQKATFAIIWRGNADMSLFFNSFLMVILRQSSGGGHSTCSRFFRNGPH